MRCNRPAWLRVTSLILAIAPGLANADPAGITGNWIRDNRTVRIAVSQCGRDLCAVNTWVKRPDGPEKIGDKLVLTLQRISPTEYKGQAYDVRRAMTYRMTVTLQDGSMQTSGCVLLGIVCKSTDWKRSD